MPRTRTGRSIPVSRRRRMNGSATSTSSTRMAARRPSAPIPPYERDRRWAIPAWPRNDVFVVDIARRTSAAPSSTADDTMPLTA